MTHQPKRRRNSTIINPEELAENTSLLSTDGWTAMWTGSSVAVYLQPFGFTVSPNFGRWAPLVMLACAAAGLTGLIWEARGLHRDGKSTLLRAYVRHMASMAALGTGLAVLIAALSVALRTKLIELPDFLQYGIPRGIVLLLLAVGTAGTGLWYVGRRLNGFGLDWQLLLATPKLTKLLAQTIFKVPTALLTGRLIGGILFLFGGYVVAGLAVIAAVVGAFRYTLPPVVSSNSLLIINAGVGMIALLVWANSALSTRHVRSAFRTG
jgi:hypothetical protein